MYVVKLLKRKDASSVVVAVWLSWQLMQLTMAVGARATTWLAGLGDADYYSRTYDFQTFNWRNELLSPFVSLLVQLVILELVIRLFVWLHPMLTKKSK